MCYGIPSSLIMWLILIPGSGMLFLLHNYVLTALVSSNFINFSGLTNLKELQLSCNKVTDAGVDYLKGTSISSFFVYHSLCIALD